MSMKPHLLITDVARGMLRSNGAALCLCHTATIFHLLTHGPSYRATDRPAGGAR
ncbi:hypothetical protein AB0O72_17135 [Streptomyces sp. NPDC088106]|uniref:hypothetical protein n=1 Tax=unclassified Streptomyces TaxID=2593676 RepID=UPI0034216803